MTNRDRLNEAISLLATVQQNDAISPSPWAHLEQAIEKIEKAATFVLDMKERDGIKSEA